MSSLRRLTTHEDGQDLLEYGLLMSLIAIFCLAAMRIFATAVTNSFWGSIAAANFF